MNTVYLVTSGEYSDQITQAIFSTREAAQEFCRYHNTKKENGEDVLREDGSYWYTPDYRIEEYEVDPEFEYKHSDKFGFSVYMSKDGEVAMCQNKSLVASQGPYCVYFFGPTPKDGIPSILYPVDANGTRVDVAYLQEHGYMQLHNVIARDEKHAIKIANEKRAQLVALNRWPTKFDRWGKAENVAHYLKEILEGEL